MFIIGKRKNLILFCSSLFFAVVVVVVELLFVCFKITVYLVCINL